MLQVSYMEENIISYYNTTNYSDAYIWYSPSKNKLYRDINLQNLNSHYFVYGTWSRNKKDIPDFIPMKQLWLENID